jgi:hypothetical protein
MQLVVVNTDMLHAPNSGRADIKETAWCGFESHKLSLKYKATIGNIGCLFCLGVLTLTQKVRTLYHVEISVQFKGNMMKVIFLDIDGVLVTKTHLLDMQEQGKPMADSQGRHLFDPKCVANLKRILDTTGAKIVLSSCWKMFGFEVFTDMWKERGCPGEIMDFTPSKLSGTRGHEIGIWLWEHQGLVESFVIIDDDTWDLHNSQMPHVVQTTWEHGLTDELTEKVLSILNLTEL